VRRLLEDPNEVVRDAAEWALRRLLPIFDGEGDREAVEGR
jgi:hypothetical protein